MMKSLIMASMLAGSLCAAEALTVNMAKSENGLNNIQKGFLYNSMPLVRNGIQEVREANVMFSSIEDTKKYLPKEKQHLGNIAYNAAKRINSAADELEIYLATNEMGKAQHTYSDIINACSACHAVVRGW